MPTIRLHARWLTRSVALAWAGLLAFPLAASALPASVTIGGSLQSELGCSGDWMADCAGTRLTYDAEDDVWQGVWTVPPGSWEYKAALDDSWTVNYGMNAQLNGPNIPLTLAAGEPVKFYYDDETHWVTDGHNAVIATVIGSFQSEIGCGSDWDPSCLRSWLEDEDGDGIYLYTTTHMPPGAYEAKVAINESLDENYGQDGVPGGANLSFAVPAGPTIVTFAYDAATHVLAITVDGMTPTRAGSWGSLKNAYR